MSLYADHLPFRFVFDDDGNFSHGLGGPHNYRINARDIQVVVTREQFNAGFTNLIPSVQADLRAEAKRNSVQRGPRRDALTIQYIIAEINNTRSGATNQISEASLMIWMCEQ
jgi:hypothetical protein